MMMMMTITMVVVVIQKRQMERRGCTLTCLPTTTNKYDLFMTRRTQWKSTSNLISTISKRSYALSHATCLKLLVMANIRLMRYECSINKLCHAQQTSLHGPLQGAAT